MRHKSRKLSSRAVRNTRRALELEAEHARRAWEADKAAELRALAPDTYLDGASALREARRLYNLETR